MIRMLPLASLILTLAYNLPATPGAGKEPESRVVIDKDKRTITIPAKVAPRKIDDPRYKEIYPIEVIPCFAFPRGQKAHETVVTIGVKPSEVHKALVDLGLQPGKPVFGESKEAPAGPKCKIFLEFERSDGQTKKVAIEKTLYDRSTKKTLPPLEWRFTGSILTKPDPNKDETVYGADQTGTLITIFPVTAEAVFQTQLTMKEEKFVKLETDESVLPKVGTPVKLIIEAPR
jgi:hypothetical protein